MIGINTVWGTEAHSCLYHITFQQQRTSLRIVNVFPAYDLRLPVIVDIRSGQQIIVVHDIGT